MNLTTNSEYGIIITVIVILRRYFSQKRKKKVHSPILKNNKNIKLKILKLVVAQWLVLWSSDHFLSGLIPTPHNNF